ncbi:MAG TPA: hydroxymethylglutaryl-CoA lyase, partial [Chloroflexota bacterium]|nr:hydroxymethylglutaryl-CoA lyase [Chloroflexota bacterium]
MIAPQNRVRSIRIVEVGPRDGLQNEATSVTTADKARFVELLVATGLRDIEVTSFVRPTAIPRLSDASELVALLPTVKNVRYWALVPNVRGLERAIAAGIRHVAIFTGATNSFTSHNIQMTIDESLETFTTVVRQAKREGIAVRGYCSVCFGCPYEGFVSPEQVQTVARRLLEIGCDELSLADTIGVATPEQVTEVVSLTRGLTSSDKIGLHFHDTYGKALANIVEAIRHGITTFDSAAGGLGGCPYAPGAPGNVAT